MDAVQEVNQQIEEHRSTLSPNQLKRLRKKRGKLMQQVVHEQLNSGSHPAAKRLCLDAEAAEQQQQQQQEEESSLQLSGHGPSTAVADGRGDEDAASLPMAAQQHPSQRHSMHQQPLPQQQQQQQPLKGSRHGIQRHRAAAVPTSSTSTDPCRTDLSGQLVVIQQELYSNGTAGDHSNSTFSQLMLQQHPAPPPAPAASDCSHGSTGTHPASTAAAAAAAAAAAGGQPPPPPQQQQQTQHQPHSRKRGRPSCQFGNYHHYYGYRLKPSGFEDPRLKVLDPSWFAGADVLDVGCNEGLVTLALAVHCGCRSVCGVDIDPVLVSKACTNLSRSRTQLNQQLHEAVRERNAQAMRPSQPVQLELPPQQQEQPSEQEQQQKTSPLGIIVASSMQPPDSKQPRQQPSSSAAAAAAAAAAGSSPPAAAAAAGGTSSNQPQQPQQKKSKKPPPHAHSAHQQHQQQQQQVRRQGPKARIVSAQRQIKALSRVSFKAGNWLDVPCPSNKYEVITCFSVTKWIQLNWGDDGVMKLFHKFYRCLAPGGLLVLEPQPFKSYKSALHKPGVAAAPYVNLDQLKLRPEQYVEFLTQRVGFEPVQQLSAVSEAAGAEAVSVKGFDRPIIVLRKPAAGGGRGGGAAAAAAEGVDPFEGAAGAGQQQG